MPHTKHLLGRTSKVQTKIKSNEDDSQSEERSDKEKEGRYNRMYLINF